MPEKLDSTSSNQNLPLMHQPATDEVCGKTEAVTGSNREGVNDNELASYINQGVLKSGHFKRAIGADAGIDSMQLLSQIDLLFPVDSD